MSLARIRKPIAALPLAGCLLVGSACAGFGLFDSADEPEPLPATAEALHAAIAVERARLMDLVSQPAKDEARWDADADVMVAIAARLSRLQQALAALEREAPVAASPHEDAATR